MRCFHSLWRAPYLEPKSSFVSRHSRTALLLLRVHYVDFWGDAIAGIYDHDR